MVNLIGNGNIGTKEVKMKFAFPLAVLLVGVACSPLMAETISLAALIDNDLSIVSGDKRFYDFEYCITGDMPPATAVNISSHVDDLGNYGIAIQGAFVDLYDANSSDALLCFSVDVLDQNKWITDVHVSGNPHVTGSGIVHVGETFIPDEADKHLSLYHINPGDNKQSADMVYLDGLYKTLHVQKDILAYATEPASLAKITVIYQTFSQVPEPSAVVSIIAGLACFGCFAWRKRR